jgi:hypothetical protein
MLLIAISHGKEPWFATPFAISTSCPVYTENGIDPNNANACRDFICKEKNVNPHCIDEVLVVRSSDYNEPPEVTHHHTSFENYVEAPSTMQAAHQPKV